MVPDLSRQEDRPVVPVFGVAPVGLDLVVPVDRLPAELRVGLAVPRGEQVRVGVDRFRVRDEGAETLAVEMGTPPPPLAEVLVAAAVMEASPQRLDLPAASVKSLGRVPSAPLLAAPAS